MSKKQVIFIINVPDSNYCSSGLVTCTHFDNYEEDKCELGFYGLRQTDNGVLKSPDCAKLEGVKERDND